MNVHTYCDCILCEYKMDGIREYRKDYYEKNKDAIKQYNNDYYITNRAKRLEQMHKYWEDNKENLKTMRNQLIECMCGGHYTLCNKGKHIKSKKHINYNELINTNRQ